MITAIIGFLYWLGNTGQLDLWVCSPTAAFVLVCVFIVEIICEFTFVAGTTQ